MDLSLGLGTVYNVLHQLKVDIGMGLNSLFAASGVSAIVFSLASKGMVEQMVGGLLLSAWDAIEVGEYVRLGDGTEGTVVRIGLIETELLGPDHVPMRVPNTQIAGKRISMYSKVTKSQVKQTLRFKYSDLEKLPKVLKAIQDEIAKQCADVPLEKPPQVVLTQYEADHIQAAVSVSLNIKPGSAEFVAVREKIMFAIADAVQKFNVDFAIPAIQYETTVSGAGGSGRHPVNIGV
jgi:small-conductance mechanosensitive channel